MVDIDDILREKKTNKMELAKKMGLSSRTGLYNIIQGNPTEESLRRLADALDVPMSRLFPDTVSGYLEVGGKVYRIRSKADLDKVMKML